MKILLTTRQPKKLRNMLIRAKLETKTIPKSPQLTGVWITVTANFLYFLYFHPRSELISNEATTITIQPAFFRNVYFTDTWIARETSILPTRRVFNCSIDNLLLLNMIFLILVFISGKLYCCIQFKVRIILIYIFWRCCWFWGRFCTDRCKINKLYKFCFSVLKLRSSKIFSFGN